MELSLVGWKVSVLVQRAPEAQQLTLLSLAERAEIERASGSRRAVHIATLERDAVLVRYGQASGVDV